MPSLNRLLGFVLVDAWSFFLIRVAYGEGTDSASVGGELTQSFLCHLLPESWDLKDSQCALLNYPSRGEEIWPGSWGSREARAEQDEHMTWTSGLIKIVPLICWFQIVLCAPIFERWTLTLRRRSCVKFRTNDLSYMSWIWKPTFIHISFQSILLRSSAYHIETIYEAIGEKNIYI